MILEFDGIQFKYTEEYLLTGIYMKAETNKITGLLGRNGSGKSTLLRIAFGSLPSDVISVRIDGTFIHPPAFSNRKFLICRKTASCLLILQFVKC